MGESKVVAWPPTHAALLEREKKSMERSTCRRLVSISLWPRGKKIETREVHRLASCAPCVLLCKNQVSKTREREFLGEAPFPKFKFTRNPQFVAHLLNPHPPYIWIAKYPPLLNTQQSHPFLAPFPTHTLSSITDLTTKKRKHIKNIIFLKPCN